MKLPQSVVVYHECLDGIAARFLFQHFFTKEELENYVFIGMDRPEDSAHVRQIYDLADQTRELIFIDYVLAPRDVLPIMPVDTPSSQRYGKVTICDHHTRTMEEFLDLPSRTKFELHIDKTKCGAEIAFEKLIQPLKPDAARPSVLDLVSMVDRGEADRAGISPDDYKAIASFMDVVITPKDLTTALCTLETLNTMPLEEIIQTGRKLYPIHLASADYKILNADLTRLDLPGEESLFVPLVNADIRAPGGRVLGDRACEYARESGLGVVLIYNEERYGIVKISVRTDPTRDAGRIASWLSGGKGHGQAMRGAARLRTETFEKMFQMRTENALFPPKKASNSILYSASKKAVFERFEI